MLRPKLMFLLYSVCIVATPPACFLSCINELAHHCPRAHSDLQCLCQHKDSLVSCLVDICPLGNLDSARDHFLGTCLEHNCPHYPARYVIISDVTFSTHGGNEASNKGAVSPEGARGKRLKPLTRFLMKQGMPSGSPHDGSVVHRRGDGDSGWLLETEGQRAPLGFINCSAWY